MGTITATVDETLAQVRLEVDWSDDPAVTAVSIWRVVGGAASKVRTPGPYDGDGQTRLPGGLGVFYDTEMPLDVPVTYEARSTYARHLSDSFTRTVPAGGWGAPDGGTPDTWSVQDGPASVFSVDGSQGVITPDVAGQPKAIRTGVPVADVDIRLQVQLDADQQGGYVYGGPALRIGDAHNLYWAPLYFSAGATWRDLGVRLFKRIAGVDTRLGSADAGGGGDDGYVPGVPNWVRVRAAGERLQVKAWRGDRPEPGWLIDVTDAAFTAGTLGVRTQTADGASTPYVPIRCDELIVTLPGQSAVISAAAVTVPGAGNGWLRDPLRPGRNRVLSVGGWARCGTGLEVVFEGLGAERFRSGTGVFDQEDYERPAVIAGLRKDFTSTLRLKSRERDGREAIRRLLAPGTPLLLQLPAVYEFDDAYLSAGDAERDRIDADHRRPWRRHVIPFAVCDAPTGPAQGTVGARWRDQCDVYDTLGEMTSAGLTWHDVLSGDASTAELQA